MVVPDRELLKRSVASIDLIWFSRSESVRVASQREASQTEVSKRATLRQ
jgi:hypothetical protein